MTRLLTRRTAMLSGAALAAFHAGQAAAEPTTLDTIRKRGVLRIGCEAAYVPFTFRDDAGKIIGYDVDLLDRFVQPLGVKAEFIDTQWSGVIPALYAGRFEMIPGVSYTKERLERVRFSIPYADASQALLVRAADAGKIKTMADMSGRVLGIKLGSPGETMKGRLDAQIKAAKGEGFAGVKTYDDHPSAYLALAQGSVDGVLNTVPTLSVVLRDKPGVFAIVYHVGSDNWHGFAFRKEDTELADFVDQQIAAMKADGSIEALQKKWFGFTMVLSPTIPELS